MREIIEKYGIWIVVALVLLVVGVVVFYRPTGPKPPPASKTMAFYIDEDTGEESTRPVTDIPPLVGKEGKPSIVQVMKFMRDDDKTPVIGYFIKYTPEGKEAMEKSIQTGMPADINIGENTLVRSPEKGSEWHPMFSNEGEKVTSALQAKAGGRVVAVNP